MRQMFHGKDFRITHECITFAVICELSDSICEFSSKRKCENWGSDLDKSAQFCERDNLLYINCCYDNPDGSIYEFVTHI